MKSHALLAAAAVLAASRAPAAEPAPGTPPRVRTVQVGAAGAAARVPASVVAARRATVATRVAASVRDVHVLEGQRVAAGQLLVSLADGDVRGGLAAAEAQLSAAAAHERRIRALAEQRAATPSELEQATAQRAGAEGAVAAVRATLGYTELRAPYAGTVTARRVDPGDFVGPGQPLVELEGDGLELHASVSEAEAQGLRVGRVLAFEAEGARGEAEVIGLTPGGDPLSHRRALRARVRSSDRSLRSGAFARLEVPAAAEGASADLWVPRSALVRRGDLTGVFVAAGGRAELRWVSLGEGLADRVEIRAGVKPGEAVVDAPGALRDGQPVVAEVAR
jgi:RND family efflux transporter MFP subunit